jgi:hypothetical protein
VATEVRPRGGLTLYARVGRLVEAVLVGLAVTLLAAVVLGRLGRRTSETPATSGTNEAAASAPAATGTGVADPAASASAPDRPAPEPGPAPTR